MAALRSQSVFITNEVNSYGPNLDRPNAKDVRDFPIANFPETPNQWYITSVTAVPGRKEGTYTFKVGIERRVGDDEDSPPEHQEHSSAFPAWWLMEVMDALGQPIPLILEEAAERAAARNNQ